MFKNHKKYFIFAGIFIAGLIIGSLLYRIISPQCNCDVLCRSLSAAYELEGRLIKMEDGVKLEQLSPNSSVLITTQINHIPVKGMLDNDGIMDAAVILTQSTGSDGLYYYVSAALGGRKEAVGTNSIGLGDRITLLGTEIENNIIYVTFLDRASGATMDMPPNVQVTRMFTVKDNILMPIG